MALAKRSAWIIANTTWYVFNFRSRLIQRLIENGYVVTVLSPTDTYVDRLLSLGVHHIHLEMDNASTNPLREAMVIARLLVLLMKERPGVLLTYTPKVNIYSSFAARWIGIPVIANVSGLGSGFIRGGWLRTAVGALYRIALRHPRKVFFQNQADLLLFLKNGLVVHENAQRLPGSGVDVDRFQPMHKARVSDCIVFLLGGRLLWEKGVGEFVGAARILKRQFPHAEFRLVGFLEVRNPSAIPRAQVEEWQAEGIIRYLGVSDEMTIQYAEADCVVLPSYYREGVPRTLLEAASMGIPIITTDTAGCRDAIVDGVTGFLTKPRDIGDLADKMRRVLCLSPEERQAMGQRGREKMRREFDERIVLDNYLKAISQIENTRQ